MDFIEGVGDEVTIFFTLLMILIVVVLAWMSTHVTEDAPVNIIIIDRRTLQRIYQVVVGFTRQQSGRLASIGFSNRNNVQASSNSSQTSVADDAIRGETGSNDNINVENNEVQQQSAEASNIEDNQKSSTCDDTKYESTISSNSESCTSYDTNQENASATSDNLSDEICTNDQTKSFSSDEITDEDLIDGNIRIKLKYLDERHRWVQSLPDETIRNFKRNHFNEELADDMVVRFINNGHELHQESQSLAFYNIADKSVIHCLFSKKPVSSENMAQSSAEIHQFDIGVFMFPIFGIILLLLWYFRLIYRNYFNAMSTFSLIGITLLFIVSLLATWRTHELHTH